MENEGWRANWIDEKLVTRDNEALISNQVVKRSISWSSSISDVE